MELKAYLRILIRRWWIFVPVFLLTLIVTTVLTLTQSEEYRATATFVVRLASFIEADKGFVSALDTLSRRTEIATTFAEVAESRMIAQQAADVLGLGRSDRRGLSVSSRLIAGTNILEISVQGNSPTLVRDYANAIGAKTVDYVRSLYEAFELSPLDEATLPGSPINSNEVLNLALGAIVGLALGMGLAFLTDYLRAPQDARANFDIVDVETGTHNRRYFMLRLQQELIRARRNGYSLSVALLDVNHPGALNGSSSQVRAEALREVASLIEPHLRDEDVMARFNDTTFAVLLPDMSGEAAKRTIEELRQRIGRTPVEIASSGLKLNIQGAAGVVAFGGNGTGQDEFLAQAAQALEIAETTTHGKVCLFSEVNDRR